jgi:hypothetical protein
MSDAFLVRLIIGVRHFEVARSDVTFVTQGFPIEFGSGRVSTVWRNFYNPRRQTQRVTAIWAGFSGFVVLGARPGD